MTRRKIPRSSDQSLRPSPERGSHGQVIRLEKQIVDYLGGIGRPWRAIDGIEAMAARGTISEPMRKAGEQFRDLFQRAGLESLHATDPTRVWVRLNCARPRPSASWGNDGAKSTVFKALEALGGMQSQRGACAWDVIGCELSIKEWASAEQIDPRIASRIVAETLAELQKHFRL
jgi:hypothetical protein